MCVVQHPLKYIFLSYIHCNTNTKYEHIDQYNTVHVQYNGNDFIAEIRLVKNCIELSAKFSIVLKHMILPICRQAARRDNVEMHFVRPERSHSAARHSQSMDTATSMGPFGYPQLR